MLWILGFPFEALGAAPRTLWLFQQLGRLAPPTTIGRSSIEADLDQIEDTLSLAARAALEIGPVQMRLKGSQRLFLDLSNAGKVRHSLDQREATALSVELGRQFLSSRNQYGRLALEYTRFPASHTNFWGLLVHSGLHDTPALPWSLALSVQVRFGFSGNESNLIVDTGTERVLIATPSNKLRFGAALSWAQRLKDGPSVVPTEHAVLTVGPSATWDSALGELKLRLNCRLWLDRDVSTTSTAYLSEFDLPAINAFWSYRF